MKNIRKDYRIKFLICLFLGLFGSHKFYEKNYKAGILYFFTCGLFFIGWGCDLIKLFCLAFLSKDEKLIEYDKDLKAKYEEKMQYKSYLDVEIENKKEEVEILKEEIEILKEDIESIEHIKISNIEEIESFEALRKQEEKKNDELKKENNILLDIINLDSKKLELIDEVNKLENEFKEISSKIGLSAEIINYKELENDLYTFQVGMFDKKYEYTLSEEYNEQLKINRAKQRDIVKEKQAINQENIDYIFSYGLKESEKNKYIDSICKLIIRTFNNECDIIINKLTVANITNSRKRLESAKEQINKLVSMYNISISMDYYRLKVDELQLQYEYIIKIQEEREEQREIKERMREEAKIQAEINRLEKESEKEQRMYEKLLERVRLQIEKANEEEKTILVSKIQTLEESLKIAEEKMKRAESMAQKTRSGYVYIISNIGSFGEDVYKIGMTRRLEPMDRVKELSDASVPFSFDVHAMIYSEDAPALEKELHNRFNEKRINKVNLRKEFFNVKLSEIEEAVKDKVGTNIKFTKLAEAVEYRQSKLM